MDSPQEHVCVFRCPSEAFQADSSAVVPCTVASMNRFIRNDCDLDEFPCHDLVALYCAGWITDEDVSDAIANSVLAQVEGLKVEAVLTLVQHYGGTAPYIPGAADPEHRLFELLDTDSAEALFQFNRSLAIGVPRLECLRRLARDRRIRKLRQQGMTARQLALRVGLTERQVYNVLARTEGE